MTFSINGALTMIFMIAYAIKSQHGTLLLIVFRMLFLGVLLAVVLTYEKWYQSYYQRWVLTISYSVISIISMASVISLDSDFVYIVVLEVMYMNVIINHISNLFFF